MLKALGFVVTVGLVLTSAVVGCAADTDSVDAEEVGTVELAARKKRDAGTPPPPPTTTTAAPTGLHVSGNTVRDGAGNVVRLRGVNRSGTEFACIQGWGFFSGATDDASLAAIASWNAKSVRIPMNETCWLGINGAPAEYSGASYRAAVAGFVARVLARGLTPILDLHWAAPGTQKATAQTPMPNRDHSVQFWREVATAYRGDTRVVFELFNEPYPDSNSNSEEAWRCWRDGGQCAGVPYTAAGMQELLTAVRGTGARNLVLLGGVQYSNSLWRWLTYRPYDSAGNTAAAWHIYNYNWYNTTSSWEQMVGPVAASVPVVATEIGSDSCSGTFIKQVMTWLDARGQGYLAWTWNVWGQCYDLVTDDRGTPSSSYGQTYRDHLLTTR